LGDGKERAPSGDYSISRRIKLLLAAATLTVVTAFSSALPALTNPVHSLDEAEACVEVLTLGHGVCISVGSPDIISREEIVRMAFEAVGKEFRILHRLMVLAFATLLRPLHPYLGEVLEFATRGFTSELIAPTRGRRRLVEYFAERASSAA
jgi:hypothetical protein